MASFLAHTCLGVDLFDGVRALVGRRSIWAG